MTLTSVSAAHRPAPLTLASRAAWAALEPLHNYMYFVPAAARLYAEAGLSDRRMAYFAARASALGPVGALPVIASFYNFSPYAVRGVVPSLWQQITPAQALETRAEAVEQALRVVLGDGHDSPELHEALGLARRAAEAATGSAQGRPLFAAHAELPWPQAPYAQLWHAQTLLREYRGDGHVATLLQAGVSGLSALILFTATEQVDGDQLRVTRGWTTPEWNAEVRALIERGLLEPGGDRPGAAPEVTEAGRALRAELEESTDRAAVAAYAGIGVAGCTRLAELAEALNRPVVKADVIPWLRARKMVTRRSRDRSRSEARAGQAESRADGQAESRDAG